MSAGLGPGHAIERDEGGGRRKRGRFASRHSSLQSASIGTQMSLQIP